MKQDVITGKMKSMRIPDAVLKTGDEIHIHIKNPAACFTLGMAA